MPQVIGTEAGTATFATPQILVTSRLALTRRDPVQANSAASNLVSGLFADEHELSGSFGALSALCITPDVADERRLLLNTHPPTWMFLSIARWHDSEKHSAS